MPAIERHETVLIGTGSGYQTAILCQLAPLSASNDMAR
jgi:protein-L-isoaspartate O-methyltransferase